MQVLSTQSTLHPHAGQACFTPPGPVYTEYFTPPSQVYTVISTPQVIRIPICTADCIQTPVV